MTHLSFTRAKAIRAKAIRPSLAGDRLAKASGLIQDTARLVRVATAARRPVVVLFAYRAALNRLEASVEGDLFDDPVLWAELKSVAWAEATREESHIP